MRTRIAIAGFSAATLTLAACVDLSGPGLDENPNLPSAATLDQSFTAVQGIGFSTLTSDLNMISNVFTQQLTGNARQWVAYDQYNQGENFFPMGFFFFSGGLIDMRKAATAARARNDDQYLGIVQVWEALQMGVAASIYGDIVYSQALQDEPGVLDPQEQVYTRLQALLDSAITNLASTRGPGPGDVDLAFGGDVVAWRRVARSLKARLYMHVGERTPAAYALALAQARQGIASSAGDMITYQSTTVGEQNRWWEFRQGRGDDVAAGRTLVEIMRARNDPRLAEWFSPNGAGQIVGQYPYVQPRGGEESDPSWLTDDIAGQDVPMPIITWAETKLIEAEAAYRTGDIAGAQAAMNAVRTDAGLAAVTPTGTALLTQIMQEKYIVTFRTLEGWNDYKRTCYPNLRPTGGRTNVIARLPYGATESQTNPNVPSLGAQPARNWNDPVNATSTDGSACLGQR
jgi:starch-binding outer membrane protein, SusD/RagB family